MRAVLAVGGIVFRDDGAVLLIQRGQPPLYGTWSLPGGKVQDRESLERAVEREVREETGLVVVARTSVDVVTLAAEGRNYEIHEILCSLKEGSTAALAPGDDVMAARWAHEDAFDLLRLTSEVREVVRLARSCVPARPLRSSGDDQT